MEVFIFLIGTVSMISLIMAQYLIDIGVTRAEFCPKSPLCGDNKTHIVCKHEGYQPITSTIPCEEEPHFISLGENHRNAIIKHLNGFRAQVVMNTVSGKDNTSLPKAYGLYKLQWDLQLAAFAQILSNLCTFKSDECRATYRFSDPDQVLGRKYYSNWSMPGTENMLVNKTIEGIIGFWRNQRKNLLPDHVRSVPSNRSEITAYMKILNSDLTHIGCGVSAYTRNATDAKTAGKRNVVQFICNLSHTLKPGAPLYPTTPDKDTDKYGCKPGENHTMYGLCIGSNEGIGEHDGLNTKQNTTIKPIETQTVTTTSESTTPTTAITTRSSTTEMSTTNRNDEETTTDISQLDLGDYVASNDECPPPTLVIVPIVTVEDDDLSPHNDVISYPIGKIREFIEIKVKDENNKTVNTENYELKMDEEFHVNANNQTFVVPQLENGHVKRVKINIPLYVLKNITQKYNFSISELTRRLMESIVIAETEPDEGSINTRDAMQPQSENVDMESKNTADKSEVELRHMSNIQRALPERKPSKTYKYDDVERLYRMVSNQNVDEAEDSDSPFSIQENFPHFKKIFEKFGNSGTIDSDENKISKKSGSSGV